MSDLRYRLDLSEDALLSLRLIREHSPTKIDNVLEGLERLRSSPTMRSQRSVPPFPLDTQLYRFQVDAATECVVLFRFGADEQTLLIDAVVIWHP